MPKVDSDDWDACKKQGNELFSVSKYPEAVDYYDRAIELLQKDSASPEDLKKLYSNRSASYYQIGITKVGEQKTRLLNLAKKDANAAIDCDKKWEKGYFRKARVQLDLQEKNDGILTLRDLIQIYGEKGIEPESDQALLQLMREYKYWGDQRIVKESKWYHKCRNKGVCIVDPHGAGLFDNIQTPLTLLKDTSVLIRPGHYVIPQGGLNIRPGHDVDLIGDTRNKHEKVILETRGSITDPGTAHTIMVQTSTLQLINIEIRQNCNHPTVHGVFVLRGGKCTLIDVKGTSRASGLISVTDPGTMVSLRNCHLDGACGAIVVTQEARASIHNTLIDKTDRVAIEVRDYGNLIMKDSRVNNSGCQAIVCHSNAAGMEVTRCRFNNNTWNIGDNEPTISITDGEVLLNDCEITNLRGQGVAVESQGFCTMENNKFANNRIAVSLYRGARAHLKNNQFFHNPMGLLIVENQKGQVTMEGNSFQSCSIGEVLTGPTDLTPKMLGSVQNKVGLFKLPVDKNPPATTKDKLRYNAPLPDPYQKEKQRNMLRLCQQCGITEEAKGAPFKACGACRVTFYCTAECQKTDWKSHKAVCKTLSDDFKMKKSSTKKSK